MPKLDSTAAAVGGPVGQAPETDPYAAIFDAGGNTQPLENPKTTLHGPPGSGKTFCALTADPDMPEKLPRADASELLTLRHTAHFGFDDGALDGLIEHNIRPAFQFSVNKWIGEGGYDTSRDPATLQEKIILKRTIVHAIEEVINLSYYAVFKRGLSVLIYDTVSMMNTGLVERGNALLAQGKWKSKRGQDDGYAMWRWVLGMHRDFYQKVAVLPAQVIFCTHTKADVEGENETEQQKAQRSARQLPGQYDKSPSITGQATEIYVGNVTIEASVQAFTDPKTGAITRWICPRPSEGFRAKNRLQFNLDAQEAPNLRLMYDKARRTVRGA